VLAAWLPDFASGVFKVARFTVFVKKEVASGTVLGEIFGGHAEHLHEAGNLLHFVFSWEDGHAGVEFTQDGTERPHVDGHRVGQSENHVGCALEAALNLGVHPFVHQTRTAEVYHFDARLGGVLEQDVFGLQVAVDDVKLFALPQGLQDLDRESADEPD